MHPNENRFAALNDETPDELLKYNLPTVKSTKHLSAVKPERQHHGISAKEQNEAVKGHVNTSTTASPLNGNIGGGAWQFVKTRTRIKTKSADAKKDTSTQEIPIITVTHVSDPPPAEDPVSTDQDDRNLGSEPDTKSAQEGGYVEVDIRYINQEQTSQETGRDQPSVRSVSETSSTEITSSPTECSDEELAQDTKEASTPPERPTVNSIQEEPVLVSSQDAPPQTYAVAVKNANADEAQSAEPSVEQTASHSEPGSVGTEEASLAGEDDEEPWIDAVETSDENEASDVSATNSSPSNSEDEVAKFKEGATATGKEVGPRKRKNRKRGKKGGRKRRKTTLHAVAVSVINEDQTSPIKFKQKDTELRAEDVGAVKGLGGLMQAKCYLFLLVSLVAILAAAVGFGISFARLSIR